MKIRLEIRGPIRNDAVIMIMGTRIFGIFTPIKILNIAKKKPINGNINAK